MRDWDALFRLLDEHKQQIPVEALHVWSADIQLTADDVRHWIRYRPDRYQRNSMHIGPAYQALVLCWQNGQRSPIHDHQGSNCLVKVISGVASETIFERGPNGMIFPTSTLHREEGFVTASQDVDIHQIANLQANDAPLVTLHVYSPALTTMNVYSLEDASVSRIEDPINYDFLAGAGI